MSILLIGTLMFIGIHLVPSIVNIRRRLIARLGKNSYKIFYSVIALAGLVLIIYGKSTAAYQPIWEPPVWSRHITITTMVFSFLFLAAADMKSNIKGFIRHPMLLGVALWSGAHLLANGDLASIILFGSFFTFSLFAIFPANKRGATTQEIKYPFTTNAITVFAGLVGDAIFAKYLHPYLIGVSVI